MLSSLSAKSAIQDFSLHNIKAQSPEGEGQSKSEGIFSFAALQKDKIKLRYKRIKLTKTSRRKKDLDIVPSFGLSMCRLYVLF
jgi:hypothetical protein